jgi:hypothetical protein
VEVREIRRDNGGTELKHSYTFLYETGNVDHQLRMGFFTRNVKRAQFISDKMLYDTNGRWCALIVLNVYATTKE